MPITLGKRGGKFRYSGAQELVFFVEMPGENGAPPRRIERARVTLPELSSEVLLMLGEKGGRMGMTAIDITPTQFPAGTMMVLNYTPAPVAFKIGATEGVAHPQKPALFGPFPVAGGNLSYMAAIQVEGGWKMITQNSYPIRPNMRFVLLLRPDADPLKPRFTWINDHVAPNEVLPPPVRR